MPHIATLLQHRAVQIALAVVALILVGSVTYYLIESKPPTISYTSVTRGTISEEVTATGIVSPLQNPLLAFEMGGQVASVQATVGEKVQAGTLLASLDTSVLAASLQAAQAKLSELEAGPRGVDVAGQQTALANAQQTLANTYSNYPQMLESTLISAQGAVAVASNPLFNTSTINDPALNFSTNNSANKINADGAYASLTSEFTTWQSELTAAGSSPTPTQLQNLTADSHTHLLAVRAYLNDLQVAITDAQPGTGITQAQQTAALAAVNASQATINNLINALTSANQSITTQQLAVQSAQDQLNQTQAGATSQDIQAQQAVVNGIEAQIKQQEIVAPFDGTVASVSIKKGSIASANAPAISLVPNGNFEVDVYLAENDSTQLTVGDAADITLDAFGAGRLFPATVASIDTSPSTAPSTDQSGSGSPVTGYKVTLLFTNNDPAIANGMHANVSIKAGSATGALIVPKSSVITDGTESYVLQKTAAGLVKAPVTIGLSNATSTQIVLGLSEGDQVSVIGSQQ